MTNPYAPPAHDGEDRDDRHEADTYIDSLPTPLIKATAVFWFAVAVFAAIFSLHILTDLRLTPLMLVIGAGHFALCIVAAGVGVGLLRGRVGLAVTGFAITPLLLLACGFALSTGALAGLMATGLVLLAPVLTAASLRSLVKMARARALLASRRA